MRFESYVIQYMTKTGYNVAYIDYGFESYVIQYMTKTIKSMFSN